MTGRFLEETAPTSPHGAHCSGGERIDMLDYSLISYMKKDYISPLDNKILKRIWKSNDNMTLMNSVNRNEERKTGNR